jgi:hypothetical protein
MPESDGDARDTVDIAPDPRAGQKALWPRRAFLALLAIIVAAGLTGWLGVHSSTATARGPGVTLSVRYAHVARAGLDVPFELTITKPAGFDNDVVLAVSQNYLGLFNANSVEPQPSSENSNGSDAIWRFDRPEGTTFVVSVDMQVQSGQHWGRSGSVTLLDASHHRTARVTFKTWLVP